MVTWKQRILWFHDNKIGIDGGAVFWWFRSRRDFFDEDGIVQDIEYQNLTGPWHPDF